MGFVTIKESRMESDLLVLKSLLESEGIKCFLKNQYTTGIMTHMATFVVELQVHESDLEKARELMNEISD